MLVSARRSLDDLFKTSIRLSANVAKTLRGLNVLGDTNAIININAISKFNI